MIRKKIGNSYYQSGYGRGRRKAPIYLINGYCYASDRKNWHSDFDPLTGELEGYIRVNKDGIEFFQVSDHTCIDRHLPY
jgi:hypothetical protein